MQDRNQEKKEEENSICNSRWKRIYIERTKSVRHEEKTKESKFPFHCETFTLGSYTSPT